MISIRSLSIQISAVSLLIFPVYTEAGTIDGRHILKQCSEAISKIHTAEYDIERRFYMSPTDSFAVRVQKRHTLECENPTDSVGLAMWIDISTDGSFLSGFDGKSRYVASGDRYTVSRPYNMWGARRLSPPFFNHAASLCDYLIAPDDKTEISCTDAGDHWIIDAQTKGKELVVFHGKKYTLPIAQNVTSQFRLRIDKNTGQAEFVAVVYDSEAEMPAITRIKEKHQIPYTVAQNNKSFYEYFLPSGLAPAVAVIDREGLISAIHIGFNYIKQEKTEKKYRAMLDKALDPTTSEE